MFIALEGVTKYGLAEASKAILQNKLGHPFFPEPSELRGLCDRAMEHHIRMRDRIVHRDRIERERIPDRSPLTQEERARQEERMRRFHAAMASAKPSEPGRPMLDPDLVAKVPDAPTNFKKPAAA